MKRHANGQAYCRWRQHGSDRCRFFGPWGSDAATAEYRRFAAEWAAGPPRAGGSGIGVAEVLAAWLDWCGREYTKNGVPTSEVSLCRGMAGRLNALYGDRPAVEFGPVQLRAFRQLLLDAGLSRATVNHYCARVVRCFKWAAGHALVPAVVYDALTCVERLRPGRVPGAERPKRQAVADEVVERTLGVLEDTPHGRVIRTLVTVQRLTGMRPGEVCSMCWADLEQTPRVWVYSVVAPKNLHRGELARRYFLGPKAQAAVGGLAGASFAPGSAVFGYWRAGVWVGLTPEGYQKTIARACRKAGVPHWTPHQLRHSLATAVAEKYQSLTLAAAAIGDAEQTAARVYVHVDPREKARREIAAEMG